MSSGSPRPKLLSRSVNPGAGRGAAMGRAHGDARNPGNLRGHPGTQDDTDFRDTRAQAELAFQALWRLNDDNLPIGLHHGSLAVEQRRKIEKAMAEGLLRAVVATSSLDLGVDWAAVDLVIQLGAPKGVSRLVQRIGRANHRLDAPSRAILVPANRFEFLECQAAADGVMKGEVDGDPPRPGGLDVLAQHILGMACAAPFAADDLYGRDYQCRTLCRPVAPGFRRHARLCRKRRLCAARL
jgi:Helicase conserved C-terminal domain